MALEIMKNASAGTLESSDAYVEITPADSLNIELESVVLAQFGEDITAAVKDVLQQCGVEKANVRVAKSWAILAVMSVLIFNQVVIANVSYHTLNMAYQKSYGILIRIADRIEQTEGATECDRILVLGALPDSHAYSADLLPNITGTTDGLIIRADDEQVGQSVLCSALNDYCSKDYSFLAGEEKRALIEKYNLADLDNWPEKESICVVDDVIVIKLGD